MTLQEAIEIVKAHQRYWRGEPPYDWARENGHKVPQAIDMLLDAAQQKPVITDEMVDAALNAVVAEGETVFWSIVFGLQNDTDELRKCMAREIVRTALQAALEVSHG